MAPVHQAAREAFTVTAMAEFALLEWSAGQGRSANFCRTVAADDAASCRLIQLRVRFEAPDDFVIGLFFSQSCVIDFLKFGGACVVGAWFDPACVRLVPN